MVLRVLILTPEASHTQATEAQGSALGAVTPLVRRHGDGAPAYSVRVTFSIHTDPRSSAAGFTVCDCVMHRIVSDVRYGYRCKCHGFMDKTRIFFTLDAVFRNGRSVFAVRFRVGDWVQEPATPALVQAFLSITQSLSLLHEWSLHSQTPMPR